MAKSMPLESFLFSTNYDVPEAEEVTEGRNIPPSDCDNTLFLARINKRWNTINHAFPGMACNVYCAVSQRPPLLRTPVQLYEEHNLLEWKFNELQFHGHNFRVVYLLGNAEAAQGFRTRRESKYVSRGVSCVLIAATQFGNSFSCTTNLVKVQGDATNVRRHRPIPWESSPSTF